MKYREELTKQVGADNIIDDKLPKWAWPGGYPLYYLDNENNVLCPACASKDGYESEPVACDVNWEDPDLYCDDCGERIESAYAEEE